MINQSSVYQETLNLKSEIEKDFLAVKPVSASIGFSSVSFESIHASVRLSMHCTVHCYACVCLIMRMFNLLSQFGVHAVDIIWL